MTIQTLKDKHVELTSSSEKYSKQVQLIDASKYADELHNQIDEINTYLSQVNASNIDFENRLDLLENTVCSGVSSIKFDKEGKMTSVEWNDGMRHLLGYENEKEFPNTFESLKKSIPENQREFITDLFQDVTHLTSGPDVTHYKHPMVCKNGEIRWFNAVSKSLRRQDGSLEELLASWRDITAEHNKDIYIEQIETIGKVFNFCSYIDLKNHSYIRIKSNEHIESLAIKISQDPFRNLKSFALETIRQEDQEAVKEFLDETTLQERLKATGMDTLEVYSPTIKGWYRLCFIGGHKDENGNYIDVIYGTTDITKDKEKEQLSKSELEEQLAIFNSLARNFRNVYMANINEGTAKILKVDTDYDLKTVTDLKNTVFPYETIINLWISQRVHPDDREKLTNALSVENLKKVFSTQEEYVGNYRSIEKGIWHDYQYNVIKIDDSGNVLAGFQIIDDIVAEHVAEEKRQAELNKKLQEALDDKNSTSEIISSLSTLYTQIVAIDLENMTYEVVSAPDYVCKITGKTGDVHSLQELIFNKNIFKDNQSSINELLDFNTIGDRLKNKNHIKFEALAVNGKWFEVNFIVKNRKNSKVTDILMAVSDIDEQKQNEIESSRELEEQFNLINTLSSNFMSIYVANIYDGSARAIRISEDYDFEEVKNVQNQEFAFDDMIKFWVSTQVYPDDKERIAQALSLENLQEVFCEQDEYVGNYRSMEGGQLHNYQFDIKKIDNLGNVVAGFQMIDSIIEEHLAQEKKQRQLDEVSRQHAQVISALSTIYTTIFRADLITHEYEVLNSVELMGKVAGHIGNFDDVKESIIQTFISDDMKDEMREFLDLNTLASRLKDTNTVVTEYRNPKGRWFQARFIVKTRDENGVANEVLYVARDFTKEKEQELEQADALRDALMVARHATRAKTTFLNNMSHDIRTPMNAIIGFTALAQTHLDNQEQVKDYLGKIHTSSTHLLSLINEILDMSRIESGTVKLEKNSVHLPDVLHDLRTMIQGQIAAKQQHLYIDTMDIVNEDVMTDKLRLSQILLNIVSNAIKYTGIGGNIIIRVTEKPCSITNHTTYEFRVKDNGIGMSKEFVDNVFDAFSRERSSTVSGIQGTGLGMSITKSIVDMMNGTITCESQLGKGTEFVVTVNFEVATKVIRHTPIPKLKGARALVVDDDVNTCQSVSKMLREIQMRPDWSTSGKEAVIRAKEASDIKDEYKVFIIDYLMPDMNGLETVRQIRKVISDEIPIIILTAYDWTDFEEEAKKAGVTAFVSKPIFMSELRRVLNQEENLEIVKEEKIYDYSGKRVLLVEDNELNQEIAKAILEEMQVMVDVANDGTEAVHEIYLADEDKYDLIFMDIQMPKMDGYTATKEIRTIPNNKKANIPIVAMTANAFEEDRQKAFESGMNGHIAKPISMETLAKTLDEIFKK